jgi:hypothetical protein
MAITTYPATKRRAVSDGANVAVAPARYDLRSVRRGLQLALAALWLLDAALQYQPYMFTKGFVTGTLAPAAQGNPAAIAAPMTWVFDLLVGHVAVFDAVFATIQLLIAAGLLWPRSVRPALAVSVAWAVGLWWIGEGLGGVLTGASPVMGAPGAAILYAIVAVAVWPRGDPADHRAANRGSVAARGLLRPSGARLVWATLWGSLAYLFLLPANRAPGALHDTTLMAITGGPGWLAGIDRHLAAAVGGNGTAASISLAVLCDLVAISIFVPRLARAGLVAAATTAALLWVAEGFGGIFTGRGTDPSSGPLLILLAGAFWPLTQRTLPATARRPISRPRIPPLTAGCRPHSELSKETGRPALEGPPRGRNSRLGLLAAVALLVTGCAAAQATTKTGSPSPAIPMPAGMPMPPGMSMPGMAKPIAPPPAPTPSAAAGPSESARMVCDSEIRGDVATALALSAQPTATPTWANHLYTCTYHLAPGPLVLSVKELPDVPAARVYFSELRKQLAPTQAVLGLASLGLPGYQTPSGTVIFLKDNKTLEVDATALPAQTGPNLVSRTDLAYQIATNILGCWTGK